GVSGDPPAPAGGPGAPRRWPRTEVRQRQRCVSPVFPPWGGWEGPRLTPRVPPDVRFVTEESFDFGVLSPSDSQEEEEDEESPGKGCRHGGGNGRWSPLRGAHLEEMMREATRLAAQLEGPVRALLPTVESQGPAPTPCPPAKPRGASAATGVSKVPPSRHSTAALKGPSGGRGLPPSHVGPPRPCPPQGQGAGAWGRSEPPRGGTAGSDGEGMGTPWPWGLLGRAP
ncbi:PSRC1 protein, partial [Eulacestoma nigropectus]|nr:PSRC1 protein [Eulacestoma nigropectus]